MPPRAPSPWFSLDLKIGLLAVLSQLIVLIWTLSKYDSRIASGESDRARMRIAITEMEGRQQETNVRLMRIETKIEQGDRDRDATQSGIKEILTRLK